MENIPSGSYSRQVTFGSRGHPCGPPEGSLELEIEELGRRATTNEAGLFRFDGIPLGHFTLRVRRIGFRSAVASLRIEAANSVTVRIPMTAWIPELESILVLAPASLSSRDQEIAQRHRAGFGSLITLEQLRALSTSRSRISLREAGARIVYDRLGRPHAVSRRIKHLNDSGSSDCPMTLFLNGMEVSDDLRQYPVVALGAVEVFRSGGEAPAQYSGLNRSCGVILLWTRDR